MRNTVRFMKDLWQDENGASPAEYALILAIAGAAIILGGAMADSATCISTIGATCYEPR